MNFALMQHHHYNLEELENVVPWEREIYIALLIQWINEESEKQKRLNQQRGIMDGN